MKLILIGASGLVGQHVLQIALDDARIERVIAPTRQPLPTHPKLFAPIVSFDDLPANADWWSADALICTLGTTMKKAKFQAAFKRVDYDYPLMAAKLAKQQGTETYVLNSAIGANVSSRFFYNQVKGELEQSLTQCHFTSLSFVRPGMIGGNRQESRPSERLMMLTLMLLGPILPKKCRINPAHTIAKALLEAAIAKRAGIHEINSEALI
ncbi:NAD-dependent dehydratase [Shewanella baltica]|uniref:NAD-dependent dehydratase n=1 Tax=Shewanella baltica TaxID=62322 RepID=UPI0030CA995E